MYLDVLNITMIRASDMWLRMHEGTVLPIANILIIQIFVYFNDE